MIAATAILAMVIAAAITVAIVSTMVATRRLSLGGAGRSRFVSAGPNPTSDTVDYVILPRIAYRAVGLLR